MHAQACGGGCRAHAGVAAVAAGARPAHLRRAPVLRTQQQPCSLAPPRACGAGSLLLVTLRQRAQAIRVHAAADAAAGEPGGASPPAPLPKPKPRRKPSLQQRWRAAKFKALDAAERLSELPAIAALLAAVATVNARLQPLRDGWELLLRNWVALVEAYNEFQVEETKRQWRWSKVYGRELDWWSRVPPFLAYFAATVAYEAFVPVSFLAAVALPWWYAWVVWDDWWRSPVFLGLLATAPLKWVPWADACLVWPGLV